MKKERLKQLLDYPEAPDTLADQIRSNWQQQLGKQELRSRYWWKRNISLVASIVATVALSGLYFQTPAVIAAAYTDIEKDAQLANGLSQSQRDWFNSKNINLPLKEVKIEMSKNCTLLGYQSKHLRVFSKEHGTINVFFHEGAKFFQQIKNRGVVSNLGWLLVKVRENLTVIALYPTGTRHEDVQNLLNTMLTGNGEYPV